MTDIVWSLRNDVPCNGDIGCSYELCNQAADEITRLRAEVAWHVEDKNAWQDTQAAHLREVTRLRNELHIAQVWSERVIAGHEQDITEITALRAENEKLRAALEPFATALQGNWSYQPDHMTMTAGPHHYDLRLELKLGNFRRARAALSASQPAPSPKGPTSWPNPTPEMLNDPTFNAIWNVIKSWDINVPAEYSGYCGATGNHVRAIWDAIMPPVIGCICPPTSEQTCQNPTCPRGPSAHD